MQAYVLALLRKWQHWDREQRGRRDRGA